MVFDRFNILDHFFFTTWQRREKPNDNPCFALRQTCGNGWTCTLQKGQHTQRTFPCSNRGNTSASHNHGANQLLSNPHTSVSNSNHWSPLFSQLQEQVVWTNTRCLKSHSRLEGGPDSSRYGPERSLQSKTHWTPDCSIFAGQVKFS